MERLKGAINNHGPLGARVCGIPCKLGERAPAFAEQASASESLNWAEANLPSILSSCCRTACRR